MSDALSTINYYQDKDLVVKKEKYLDFTNNWFESKWSCAIANKSNIYLYDVGIDLIEFDKAVATNFLSYGYTNAGIQWIFKGGIKEIFSSTLYNQLLRDQTIVEQSFYDSYMVYSGPDLSGLDVTRSFGTLIVNNKVWLLNRQIESIKFGFDIYGHSIFKNKDLNESNMLKTSGKVEELSYPFLTSTLKVLRAGIVLLIIFLTTILPTYITFLVIWIVNSKKGETK